MKKYWAYFTNGLKVNSAYKINYYFSLIIDVVFFYIYYALWSTIYKEGGISHIGTYSLSDTVTYYFVAAFLFKMDVSGSIYLNWTIWSGYFTNDLIKPWSIPLVTILDAIAERFYVIISYLPIAVLIYFSTKDYLVLPNFQYSLLFLVTLVFSFILNIAFNLIFHALCFYFGDQDANISLFNYIAILLAGAVFPLAFLPEKLRFFFELLPFKALFFIPTQVFLGKMELEQIYLSWLQTVLWAVAFYLLFKYLYKRGLRHYTGTGR